MEAKESCGVLVVMEDIKPAKLLPETATPSHKEMEKTALMLDHPADRTARVATILLTTRLTTRAGKAQLVAARLKRKTRLMTPKPVS